MYATAEDLMVALAEEDVTLPSGRLVRVRALTLGQVRDAYADDGDGLPALIAAAMVQPAMTVDQATAWMDRAPAGDAQMVQDTIQRLSGMLSTKRNLPTDRDRPEPSE